MRQELFLAENRAAEAEASLEATRRVAAVTVSPPPEQQDTNALHTRIADLENQLRCNNKTTDAANKSMANMLSVCKEMREESDASLELNTKLREEAAELMNKVSEAKTETEKWKEEVRRLENLMEYKEQRVLQFAVTQKERVMAPSQEHEQGLPSRYEQISFRA